MIVIFRFLVHFFVIFEQAFIVFLRVWSRFRMPLLWFGSFRFRFLWDVVLTNRPFRWVFSLSFKLLCLFVISFCVHCYSIKMMTTTTTKTIMMMTMMTKRNDLTCLVDGHEACARSQLLLLCRWYFYVTSKCLGVCAHGCPKISRSSMSGRAFLSFRVNVYVWKCNHSFLNDC